MAAEEFTLGMEADESSEGSGEQVSEEAKQRIRDNQQKAKQVRTKIQQVQQQNQQFAGMLTLLLQHVDDEKMLGYIFSYLVDKHISIPVLFALFLPHLQQRVSVDVYAPLYGHLREQLPTEYSVVSLVQWLHQVRQASPRVQQLDNATYVAFTLDYLNRIGVVDVARLDTEQHTALRTSVEEVLEI